MVNSTVKEQDEMFNDELTGMHNYRYGSSDGPVLNMNQQLQVYYFFNIFSFICNVLHFK
jgi:hypothetical protein